MNDARMPYVLPPEYRPDRQTSTGCDVPVFITVHTDGTVTVRPSASHVAEVVGKMLGVEGWQP